MTNERLRQAMAAAHVDIDAISSTTNVDPKTVQRWLGGRVPHQRHRWKVANLLREREDYLWPPEETQMVALGAQTAEIVAAYSHRADIAPSAWWNLFTQAKRQIDLLGFAMLFLPEQHPGLIDLLKTKAAAACQMRIALADPTSIHVHIRDQEEKLGGTLPARIQTTLYQLRELHNRENIQIHLHSTPMYNSVFRFDDEMFVCTHLYGLHGSKAPLYHLRRLGPYGIFAGYAEHFDNLWATTVPVKEITLPTKPRYDILPASEDHQMSDKKTRDAAN